MPEWFWYGLAAVLIGAIVGIGELVARYRDAPATVFKLPSAWLYMILNATAAGVALFLMRSFGWTFGGDTGKQEYILQLLVAGFGSMAFLRSSLFTIKVGDTDVGVGPSALLTILLNAADRNIDRVRGEARLKAARSIMKDFNLDRTEAVTSFVLAAMQNVSPEEVKSVVTAVAEPLQSSASDEEKAVTVGLVLLNLAGEKLLREAVVSKAPSLSGRT